MLLNKHHIVCHHTTKNMLQSLVTSKYSNNPACSCQGVILQTSTFRMKIVLYSGPVGVGLFALYGLLLAFSTSLLRRTFWVHRELAGSANTWPGTCWGTLHRSPGNNPSCPMEQLIAFIQLLFRRKCFCLCKLQFSLFQV